MIWFYPNLQFNLVDAIRESRGRRFQIDWQVKFIASRMINLNLTTRCLSFFCKFCTTLANFKTVTRSGCIVCHEMWPFWNGLLFKVLNCCNDILQLGEIISCKSLCFIINQYFVNISSIFQTEFVQVQSVDLAAAPSSIFHSVRAFNTSKNVGFVQKWVTALVTDRSSPRGLINGGETYWLHLKHVWCP